MVVDAGSCTTPWWSPPCTGRRAGPMPWPTGQPAFGGQGCSRRSLPSSTARRDSTLSGPPQVARTAPMTTGLVSPPLAVTPADLPFGDGQPAAGSAGQAPNARSTTRCSSSRVAPPAACTATPWYTAMK